MDYVIIITGSKNVNYKTNLHWQSGKMQVIRICFIYLGRIISLEPRPQLSKKKPLMEIN